MFARLIAGFVVARKKRRKFIRFVFKLKQSKTKRKDADEWRKEKALFSDNFKRAREKNL